MNDSTHRLSASASPAGAVHRLARLSHGCALALLVALASGCGSDTPETKTSASGCDALVSECLINQMACVEDAVGVASCELCPTGTFADDTATCVDIGGTVTSHTFPENTTGAGSETLGMCRSWTLNNAEPLWVNAVELEQNEASHHSNWVFVPDTEYEGADGAWPCAERGYSQLAAALAGGVLYAQSTQAPHEVQKFPDGVVVRIPANARIVSDVHTLNTSGSPITGTAQLNLYSIPEDQVTVKLAPFHVTYDGLDIPAQSTSRFTGECALEDQFQMNGGGPVDMKIYYLLPHTHALGTRMFVEAIGGPVDGMSLIDVSGFNGEARGRAYDPPIDMAGATGIRFGCEFTNPRAESVGWGFDDQEMCEALGFAASPIAFESRVSAADADGEDDGIAKFTGACSTISFAWQQ